MLLTATLAETAASVRDRAAELAELGESIAQSGPDR